MGLTCRYSFPASAATTGRGGGKGGGIRLLWKNVRIGYAHHTAAVESGYQCAMPYNVRGLGNSRSSTLPWGEHCVRPRTSQPTSRLSHSDDDDYVNDDPELPFEQRGLSMSGPMLVCAM